jgi:hypothetical protein
VQAPERGSPSISIRSSLLTRISSKNNQHISRKLMNKISSTRSISRLKGVNSNNKSELLKHLLRLKPYLSTRSKGQSTALSNLITINKTVIRISITSRYIMFRNLNIISQSKSNKYQLSQVHIRSNCISMCITLLITLINFKRFREHLILTISSQEAYMLSSILRIITSK